MSYVDSKNPEMTSPTEAGTAAASDGPMTVKQFCTKSMIGSMLVTMVLFSFTLSGMMSAGTWVVNRYVVPRLASLTKLPPPAPQPAARPSDGSEAAASIR